MSREHASELLLDFGPDGQTLVPVVTQDLRTKEVLILAFANREAFEETRRSGFATYWSRSRNELWKKGLTSGDLLKVEEIRINCEQNSLLYLVTPQGRGACHAKRPDGNPYRSCYYRRLEADGTLRVLPSLQSDPVERVTAGDPTQAGPILRIGMPAGSLATAQRGGNLGDVLALSGFRTSGYDKGGPTKFSTVTYLFGWDGRPQEFGAQLELGELDVAIGGDDWIRERSLELKLEYGIDAHLERAMTMNRGEVKIVGIVADSDTTTTTEYLRRLITQKSIITVASEMPYLALDWIQNRLREIDAPPGFLAHSVQKYKTPPKIQKGIVVYESWGKTESKVKNGGVDIGLEISQTGSAIKGYGLRVIETIMQSQSSVWIRPAVRQDPQKRELLEMLLLNLYGSLQAENKVMILFNVPNALTEDVERYLSSNNLFGDEPTINKGKEYTEYNIQVDTNNPDQPLALIRYRLARLGGRSINTIPITSAIPGIRVIA